MTPVAGFLLPILKRNWDSDVALPTEYNVWYSDEAADQLRGLDGSIRSTVAKKIRRLNKNPDQQGAPLLRQLAGHRRIYCAGRYRALYRILDGFETELDADGDLVYLGRVAIVCIGIRKDGEKADVYEVAGRIIEVQE